MRTPEREASEWEEIFAGEEITRWTELQLIPHTVHLYRRQLAIWDSVRRAPDQSVAS